MTILTVICVLNIKEKKKIIWLKSDQFKNFDGFEKKYLLKMKNNNLNQSSIISSLFFQMEPEQSGLLIYLKKKSIPPLQWYNTVV